MGVELLKKLGSIAWREGRMILQDSRLRSVVLVAPIVYAGLFCLVYSRHTLNEIPIAVMDLDRSGPSRQLVRMLGASQKLKIQQRVHSLEEIKDQMWRGTVDAAVVIDRQFTTRLKRGRGVPVTAYLNGATMVSANMAGKAINQVVQTFSAGVEIKTLMKKGARLEEAKQRFMPVRLDLRPMFNPSFNYTNFMVPGLLIAILQQVILMGVALSWTGEKEKSTLPQLFQISQNPLVLLLGKSLPYLLINALVAEFYLRVLFPLNDIPMEGHWAIAIPFTFLFILVVTSWGMWASALCRTRLFATQVLMFVALPSFVLSGFTWPAQAMPQVIQWLAQLLPITHFVNSFRNVYLGAAPFQYVRGDFLTLGGFLLVNVTLAYFAIRQLVIRRPT